MSEEQEHPTCDKVDISPTPWVAFIYRSFWQALPVLIMVCGFFWNLSLRLSTHEGDIGVLKADVKDIKDDVNAIKRSLLEIALKVQSK